MSRKPLGRVDPATGHTGRCWWDQEGRRGSKDDVQECRHSEYYKCHCPCHNHDERRAR